jgi:uncharacterized repeat protein (TIGR01451 family)
MRPALFFSFMMWAACTLIPFSLYGQITWQPLGGPQGVVDVNGITCDDHGNVFMAKNTEIFRSSDQGATWQLCMNGLPTSQLYGEFKIYSGEMHIQNSAVVYRYNRTSDAWATIYSNWNGGFGIDTQNTWWRSNGGGVTNIVSYSTNEGVTYTTVPMTGDTMKGWFDAFALFNDDHNLLAASYGSLQFLYHFTKGGQATKVLEGFGMASLTYHPTTGTAYYADLDSLYRSGDKGLTWKSVYLPTLFSYYDLQVQFDTFGNTWFIQGNSVFKSIDDGLTATIYPIPQQVGYSTYFVGRNHEWYGYGYCEPYDLGHSNNDGQAWNRIGLQFEESTLSNLSMDAQGQLYGQSCDYGQKVSADGGKVWEDFEILDGANRYPVIQYAELAGGSAAIARSALGGLYRKVNGSSNWEPFSTGSFGVSEFIVANQHTNTFFIFTDWQSFKSTDYGLTWSSFTGSSLFYPSVAAALPTGDIVISHEFGVSRYIAALDTVVDFNPTSSSFPLYAPFVQSDAKGDCYLLMQDQTSELYRNSAGSNVWTPIQTPSTQIYSFCVNDDGHIFLITSDSLFSSVDIGSNWQFQGKLPLSSYYARNIYCLRDGHLYYPEYGGIVHRSTQPVSGGHKLIGKVWVDENNDCLPNALEQPRHARIKADGIDDYITYSNALGDYRFSVPSGSYAINVVPPNALYKACKSDTQLNFASGNDTTTLDLPLGVVEYCSFQTVRITSPLLRRCFDNNAYYVQYQNEGTASENNVVVTLTLDSLLSYVSSTLPVATQVGQTLTFNVGDLQPGQTGQFVVTVKVSCDASLGQVHCSSASISPVTTCATNLPDLAQTTDCQANIGAFDPNDKRVYVDGVADKSYVDIGQPLTYLIRFQNTGTDTAFNITVQDRITPMLDLTTLTPIMASHPYEVEIDRDRVVRFIFKNIMLPDSNINEMASHGFIKFSIGQSAGNQLGSRIKNAADIFFDFNAPVATNEVEIQVGMVNTYTPEVLAYVHAQPNPFTDQVRFDIAWSGEVQHNDLQLEIYDVAGKRLSTHTFQGQQYRMDASHLPSGFYQYRLMAEQQQIGFGKLVKR